MTPDDARRCAIAIADTWPSARLSVERWLEPLERHDLDQARTTYRWFRDHTDHAPTIAQFHAKLRELHTGAIAQLREPCAICDGTGWQQVEQHIDGHPWPTSAVRPCRCTNGQRHVDAYRKAVQSNADNRRDTAPLGHQESAA